MSPEFGGIIIAMDTASESFREFSRSIALLTKRINRLDSTRRYTRKTNRIQERKLRRGVIEYNRRPALIHKGGKP